MNSQDYNGQAFTGRKTSAHYRYVFPEALIAVMFVLMTVFTSFSYGQQKGGSLSGTRWVGTWATAPQLVEPGNMPPSPGLANNSLRQVVEVSIGGDTLRMKFSNEFSTSAVTMKSVHIAVSTGGSAIDTASGKVLEFSGSPQVTMVAGAAVTSDPIAFHLTPRMQLAITIYYGQTSSTVTGHPGSRTTSYILTGDAVSKSSFAGAATTDHWYNIDAIDVLAPSNAACVAILGNSITDGRGSTTNLQNRWPDIFSERLLQDSSTHDIGVLNMGIGGNAVLAGGLGPTGVSRFDRDIIDQNGVRWVIVFEGVNDIGGVRSASAATSMADNLIAAYKEMITKAHANNITIYGATITPFKGNGYYNQYSESCREAVNRWIRTAGNFDACIDFDKAMRNPQDTLSLVSSYQNDGLHPDSAGHRKMGDSVDLSLFTLSDTTATGVQSPNAVYGFVLEQNYPNPFNPSTSLSFNLPSECFVSLVIFDSIGREVATVVSDELPAGSYSRRWNAADMASGVYYCRLSARPLSGLSGSFIETRKLLLLK